MEGQLGGLLTGRHISRWRGQCLTFFWTFLLFFLAFLAFLEAFLAAFLDFLVFFFLSCNWGDTTK